MLLHDGVMNTLKHKRRELVRDRSKLLDLCVVRLIEFDAKLAQHTHRRFAAIDGGLQRSKNLTRASMDNSESVHGHMEGVAGKAGGFSNNFDQFQALLRGDDSFTSLTDPSSLPLSAERATTPLPPASPLISQQLQPAELLPSSVFLDPSVPPAPPLPFLAGAGGDVPPCPDFASMFLTLQIPGAPGAPPCPPFPGSMSNGSPPAPGVPNMQQFLSPRERQVRSACWCLLCFVLFFLFSFLSFFIRADVIVSIYLLLYNIPCFLRFRLYSFWYVSRRESWQNLAYLT